MRDDDPQVINLAIGFNAAAAVLFLLVAVMALASAGRGVDGAWTTGLVFLLVSLGWCALTYVFWRKRQKYKAEGKLGDRDGGQA
ncbi:MAG: hypothetical protein ACFB22_11705 [Rhodothalassiaceae bacterium]